MILLTKILEHRFEQEQQQSKKEQKQVDSTSTTKEESEVNIPIEDIFGSQEIEVFE